jgi:NAD(P)-dependent dehydrogenase (short-subunit alcohol dehydrogenase family)
MMRAVVTGAGSGLGRAFCTVLSKRGAKIVAADINLETAKETAQMTGAHPVACDVSKISDVEKLADEAEKALGGVDLVVNNAGVGVFGRIGEATLEDWQFAVNINLWGVVHGCHVFVPRLRRQKSGRIINVASAAGLLAPPQLGPYNVTKAAVVALSETLAGELGKDGIGVTVLCPTFFPTNIAKSGRGTGNPKMLASLEKLMAQSKFTAEDVAAIALDSRELYVIPQADGRWMWRLKRALPDRFHRLGPPKTVMALMKRK